MRAFGIMKVPLIWWCRPKVVSHTDDGIEVKIPLRFRTKNHLGSMYFGVLAVGADVTGGFLAMDPIIKSGRKVALIFKDFSGANFKLNENIWTNYNWDISHCILRGENSPIKSN